MPEKILIKTPPGYDLKSCIELFKKEYSTSPLNTHLIFPTERLVNIVKQNLLNDGLTVIEGAVTTPKEFAESIADKNSNFRLITEEEAKMLLLSVIKQNRTHIESISHSKEFSLRLLNDIYTLITVLSERQTDYARVFSKNLSKKNRALLAIIKDYQQLLKDKNLIAPEEIYTASKRFLEKGDSFSPDLTVIFSGIYEPQASLKKFITAVGDSAKKTVYFMPFCSDERICSDSGDWFSADITVEKEADFRSSVYTGIFTGSVTEKKPAMVYAKRYKSIKKEISGIAAEIQALLKDGAEPFKIAVAFPDPAGATAIIEEIFPDFKLPFSSSATFPFSRSPVVSSVLLITEVISGNFSRENVTELFSSPYIRSDIKPSVIDFVAGKAIIEDGFSSWERNISRYIRREEGYLLSQETPDYRKKEIVNEIATAKSVLNGVLPALKELNSLIKDDTYRGHIQNLLLLLKRWDAPHIDADCGTEIEKRDNDDLKRLLLLLNRLSDTSDTSGEEQVSFYEFSRFLSSAAGNMRVSQKRDASAIQVMGIQGLQYTEFDFVFLGGLVDGKIPDIPSLLPYTNEAEDQAIWPKKRREKVRWERFYFISALCPAKKAVYLSCHNEAEGRQEIPSQFYETASNALSAESQDDKEPLDSFSYSVAKTGEHLLKGEVYSGFCLPDGVSAQSVAERINIEGFHRKGLYDTSYDGLLQDEDGINDILEKRFGKSHAYSPTSLETYAGCPFRFYLKHVLGLNPPAETTFTLSPSDRGSLIHNTLFSFYSEWKKNHPTAPAENEKEEALSLLKSCAKENIEAYGMQGPAWDSMAREILGDTGYGKGILEKFAEEETKLNATGLIPEYFEAGFGFKGAGTSFSDEPVEVVSGKGKSIFLRGFVDRIDVKDGRDFVIVDYKTGNHPKLRDISEGKALQIPLYLRAVGSAKDLRGIGGFYYRISKKDVSRRAELYDTSEEMLFSNFKKSRLKDESFEDIVERAVYFACRYAENIRRGIFTPAGDASGCSDYCEFKNVCRFSEFRLLEQENEAENQEEEKAGETSC
ncbi:MAG: PD-(D/E)XK nuclease family protein [Methanomicrobiaceae archaeon]|nr:PD-(D/E)XK nuclease family protein [Methanomicrobiaceae archaeon]